MSILAINAGSSSLKFGLFDEVTCEPLLAGDIDWAGGNREAARLTMRPRAGTMVRKTVAVTDDTTAANQAIQAVVEVSGKISAVGHRVVHGGEEFRHSVLIDTAVKGVISRLSELAPLHNPPALKAIEAAEAALPGIPGVAVFDTAFYTSLEPQAYLYAVPYEWYERWRIRRFGFHGISHAYCAERAAEMLGRDPGQLRIISCHLGSGCSITGVRGGAAAATTMGFSPLEGLMMGTRCGSVDPGILLHLQRQKGLTHEDLSQALTYSAGLLGISGVSADMAKIELAAEQGNQRARLAFEMFAGQVRSAVGGMAATLGGVDAVTFTGGIGEGSATLRTGACEGLKFMGMELDPDRNGSARPDTDIASGNSRVRILVVHTEEELMVAREVHRILRK